MPKKSKKETKVEEVKQVQPTYPINQHLKNIHLFYDKELKKIFVAEVELDGAGIGSCPREYARDITSEFLQMGALIADSGDLGQPQIITQESSDNKLLTIFLKESLSVNVEDINIHIKKEEV